MAISGMSATTAYASGQHPVSSLGPHKHGGHHSHAAADVDITGSAVTPAKGSSGKIGNKVNITA
jgi:hypothetical protein